MVVAAMCFFFTPLYGQESIFINVNSYKTALPIDGVGDWNDPTTWEVWNGTDWTPASTFPDRTNDVFIDQAAEVRLIQYEEVRNLYLFSSADASKKLNLQVYNLDVFGTLGCYTEMDGEFMRYGSTSLLMDWIYPETGNIVFKGTSRTIVDRASWSANNLNSRYGVIFNPDPNETLTVNAAFKASNFVVQSGTVIQSLNEVGTPATSTFSFNTNDEFGTGAYGNFYIEPGATLISYGTNEFGQILRRSNSTSAESFLLKEGGTLVLYGKEPFIEAENILLEGDVHYMGELDDQQFIASSFSGYMRPGTYNNLFFQGAAVKHLPFYLDLRGDLTYLGGGILDSDSTFFDFVGEGDQEIIYPSLEVANLQLRKPSGTLFFDGDVSVIDHFTMNFGRMDFLGNQLSINLSGNGSYSYYGGTWTGLGQLNYLTLPSQLDSINSSFPYEDQYLGGERRFFFSGDNSSENADLTIVYTQLPGVNWDPDFNDIDSTPILYKLNSFFTMGVTNYGESDVLDMRISADNLIVIDEQDLRIVSDQSAAPGSHLLGVESDGGFYAGRSLSFSDLNNQTFTIGSTGIASILPVTWLSYSAEELLTGNLISWSTSMEVENKRFIILRSTDIRDYFDEIGEVAGSGNSNEIQHYSFLDKDFHSTEKIFYQIKQVDLDGGFDFSPVFSLHRDDHEFRNQVRIFPNPYENGTLILQIPRGKKEAASIIEVQDISGIGLISESGQLGQASQKITDRLKKLGAGIYFIGIESTGERQVLKWLKK